MHIIITMRNRNGKIDQSRQFPSITLSLSLFLSHLQKDGQTVTNKEGQVVQRQVTDWNAWRTNSSYREDNSERRHNDNTNMADIQVRLWSLPLSDGDPELSQLAQKHICGSRLPDGTQQEMDRFQSLHEMQRPNPTKCLHFVRSAIVFFCCFVYWENSMYQNVAPAINL